MGMQMKYLSYMYFDLIILYFLFFKKFGNVYNVFMQYACIIYKWKSTY